MDTTTRDKLRRYIERVEAVAEERKALTKDIADILAQAKSDGFDIKVMREVLRLRRMSTAERQEAEAILATYLHALDAQMDMFEREQVPA
jgi:uncharacterized protein (UPF0335 family)